VFLISIMRLKPKKTNNKTMLAIETEIKNLFAKMIKEGAKPQNLMAIEKIYRLETNHFKSGQFLQGYSAGMEKFNDSFPYGWTSLKQFWINNPSFKPIGFTINTEGGTGIKKTFLKFKTPEAAIKTLYYFLSLHKFDVGRWHALTDNSPQQLVYENKILKVH
jgi:hypothetical protein